MGSSARETYIDSIDRRFAPLVRELDRIVTTACPDLEPAIKYRILMYALAGDFRSWVCAIDARKNAVCLRFLFGALLDDPRGVLRPGTSSLKTIDYASLDQVDAGLVADYVAEAVARHDEFKAAWPGRRAAMQASPRRIILAEVTRAGQAGPRREQRP